MGPEPNLSVSIYTMENFDGDGHGHGDGTCKRALRRRQKEKLLGNDLLVETVLYLQMNVPAM